MKKIIYIFYLIILVIMIAVFPSCFLAITNGNLNINNSPAKETFSESGQAPVFDSNDKLVFVLQCADFGKLYRADFDIAVIDCDDTGLKEKEINSLKSQGKSIVSYLSIGEAENYRPYWQNSWKTGDPGFLEEENPDWPGNFKVKFWDFKWQEIIFSKLENIVQLGYNGVYLDVVDAYVYFEKKGYGLSEYYMREFVKNISVKAKSINPRFLVIPQNAEPLAAYEDYLEAVDGLGRENLWFEKNKRVNEELNSNMLNDLIYARDRGKFIFAVNYSDIDALKNEFLSLCDNYGFIPYTGPVELDLIQ